MVLEFCFYGSVKKRWKGGMEEEEGEDGRMGKREEEEGVRAKE